MKFRLLESQQNVEVDSLGNNLTQEQSQYFINSQARGTDNKLLVCYHGSDVDFNRFDSEKLDFNNGKLQGFWFTTNPDYAAGFGHLKECYLNLCNPIPLDKLTITAEQLSEISGYSIKSCKQAIQHFSSDYEAILSISRIQEKYKTTISKVKELLGYDGYTYTSGGDTIIVVFSPNQIKLVSNIHPTNSDNINETIDKFKIVDLIQQHNPFDEKKNAYATWIRSEKDIKDSYAQAVREDETDETGITPDFTAEDIQRALKTNKMVVYSTHKIQIGTFVTPSKMEAEAYGVDEHGVYSKVVNLDEVAWIDSGQGQYIGRI